MSKNCLVIGAGFGGIASALRLRRLGYNVTIVDKNPHLGGRAQVYKRGEFKFDAGPTVLTAPYLIDDLFSLFNKDRKDYIEFLKVKPWYRFVFNDKVIFDYRDTIEGTLDEISKISPNDVHGYKKLINFSEKIFNKGFLELSSISFHSFGLMLKQLPALILLRSYLSVYSFVSSFLKNDKLRRAFSIHPLLVGGNPFSTTSIYCLIHYLERKYGIWFPKGGTSALVSSLGKLMDEVGINVRLSTEVSSLEFDGEKIISANLSNTASIDTDIVVSNCDPPFFYNRLVPDYLNKKWNEKRLKKMSYSMGLFVWYFATKKEYKDVEHHTIIMGKTFKKVLNDIYNKKVISNDLSLYLHRPSATDKDFDPSGNDSFYVLAPVPHNGSGINWTEKGEEIRLQVQKQLENTLLPELEENIVESFFVTPETFSDKFNSFYGAGFSIAPKLTQSAWFRFHNKSEDIENLYFCGAGTHPGAGVPGVLSSAKVVEKLVSKFSQDDYNKANDIFKKNSLTFSLASKLFNKKEKIGISNLYKILRVLDDYTDNYGSEKNKLEAIVSSFKRNLPHPLLEDFFNLRARFDLEIDYFRDFIDTLLLEDKEINIKNDEDLSKYCYGVAGSVGSLLCPIIGVKNPEASYFAESLGTAMQITNIVRDVYEDAQRDRIYIPSNYFKNIPTCKDILHSNSFKKEVKDAKYKLLEKAESHYAIAWKGLKFIPFKNRIIVAWAGLMYREIGLKILKNQDEYFKNRATVTNFRKVALLFPALFKAILAK